MKAIPRLIVLVAACNVGCGPAPPTPSEPPSPTAALLRLLEADDDEVKLAAGAALDRMLDAGVWRGYAPRLR